MHQRQPDDIQWLRCEIEYVLAAISIAPDDLAAHLRLRSLGLQYKAEGGPPAGAFKRIQRPPSDAVERLVHFERLWALDPGNSTLVPKMLATLAAVKESRPERDLSAIRRWLYGILANGNAES